MRALRIHGGIFPLLLGLMLGGGILPARGAALAAAGTSLHFRSLEMGTAAHAPGDSLGIEELVFGVWTRINFAKRWNARLEFEAVQAKASGDWSGEIGALSGAALLRYERPERGWLIQAGIGLPAGDGDLTTDENALIRHLSDPLGDFADPEPVRPLRLHVGASGGRIINRWLTALAGAGYEHSASHKPLGDLAYDAGARFTARLGLRGAAGDREGQLRVALVWAGRDKLGGERYRDGRRYVSVLLSGRARWVGLSLGLSGTWATSSAVDWLIEGGAGQLVAGGPGQLGGLSAELAPARLIGGHLRPKLTSHYRRHVPDGLPYGDGWLLAFSGGLWVTAGSFAIDLDGGWQSGTWHRWANPGYERASDLAGPRASLALSWERSGE